MSFVFLHFRIILHILILIRPIIILIIIVDYLDLINMTIFHHHTKPTQLLMYRLAC